MKEDLSDFVRDARDVGELMIVGLGMTLAGAGIFYQSAVTSSAIMGVCAITFGLLMFFTAIADFHNEMKKMKEIEKMLKSGVPYKEALTKAQPDETVDYNHEDVNDVT